MNDQGSVIFAGHTKIRELPAELQSQLTDLERDCLQVGPAYFLGFAAQAGRGWLKQLLQDCAESDWQLEFWPTTGQPPDETSRLFFRFLENDLAVSLPHRHPEATELSTLPIDLPSFVIHLYSLVGAIQKGHPPQNVGLWPYEDLTSAEQLAQTHQWELLPHGAVDPQQAVVLLNAADGRYLCALPDEEAAWLTPLGGHRVVAPQQEQSTTGQSNLGQSNLGQWEWSVCRSCEEQLTEVFGNWMPGEQFRDSSRRG